LLGVVSPTASARRSASRASPACPTDRNTRQREIVVGVDEVRLPCQRQLKAPSRLLELAACRKHEAELLFTSATSGLSANPR
jgi:hypothetical protein